LFLLIADEPREWHCVFGVRELIITRVFSDILGECLLVREHPQPKVARFCSAFPVDRHSNPRSKEAVYFRRKYQRPSATNASAAAIPAISVANGGCIVGSWVASALDTLGDSCAVNFTPTFSSREIVITFSTLDRGSLSFKSRMV